MTLDEFRRNWTLPSERHDPSESAPAPVPVPVPAQRLMFVPPQEPVLVPRLVFREGFAPAAPARPQRLKGRGLGRILTWAVIAVSVVLGLAIALDKMFEVADGYVETYVLDAT